MRVDPDAVGAPRPDCLPERGRGIIAEQLTAAGRIPLGSPRDGSKVSKRRLTLRAAPDVPGTSDGAKVVFSVDWPGSAPQEACVADAPTDAGAWQCEVDLAVLRAPAGSLKLDFDVRSREGTIDASPDGKRTVDYQPAAATWRSPQPVFPKGCFGPSLVIDGSSRYHVAATCGDKVGYAEGTATGGLDQRQAGSACPAYGVQPTDRRRRPRSLSCLRAIRPGD